MLYLVTYDVPSTDNGIRDKIAHALKAAGLVRVQYSVFWGILSRNEAESVALKVQQILGTVEGDVRVVPICKKCRARLLQVTTAGGGSKATIARGTATVNTKFLSRPAKALLGQGAPAVPTPTRPAMPLNSPNLNFSIDDADPAAANPPPDAFDIDVITAKKKPPAPLAPPSVPAPPPVTPPADATKKPFLLI